MATQEFQVDFSIGYLNLEYKKFDFGGEDLSGYHLQKAPDWTVHFSPQYATNISPQFRFLARLDVYHTGKAYSDPLNTETIARKPVTLIDARIAVSFRNERYRVALWGKNLTEQIFVQHGTVFDWGDQVAVNPPRTFGVELMMTF